MSRALLAVGAVLGLVLLQTGAGGAGGCFGLRPDFFLLAVVAVAMRRGEVAGAGAGIALGFLQDALSAGPGGAGILEKGLVGLAVGALREQLDCANPNTQAIVASVATLAGGVLALTLLHTFSTGHEIAGPLFGTVLPAAALHGVLLPGVPAALGALARAWRLHTVRADAD